MLRRPERMAVTALFGTFVLAMTAGCAGVQEGDMNSAIADLRQDMEAEHSQLSSRIDDLDRRVGSLESELQSMRNDFNMTMERMEGAMKFSVPVHFAFDKAELRELDKPVLDRFAGVVKEFLPDALVTVEGFADPAGSEAYNLDLGMRRARSVKQYLTTAGGLQADRVKTVSYGESPDRQVVPGARGPGMTGIENRRVALVIDYEGSVRN